MTINPKMTLEEYLDSLRNLRAQVYQKYLDYDQRIKGLETDLGVETDSAIAITHTEPEQSVESKPTDLSGLTRKQAAIEILRREKRPLTTREIAERLELNGKDTSKDNIQISVNNALTKLLKNHVVKKRKSGTANTWVLENTELAKQAIERILTVRPTKNGGGKRGPYTYGGIAEEAIRKAGRPLHLKDITKAVNDHGLHPTRGTLSSGLVKDSKGRFKNLGGNMYTLTEWESKSE
jgi:hypothetical protein